MAILEGFFLVETSMIQRTRENLRDDTPGKKNARLVMDRAFENILEGEELNHEEEGMRAARFPFCIQNSASNGINHEKLTAQEKWKLVLFCDFRRSFGCSGRVLVSRRNCFVRR